MCSLRLDSISDWRLIVACWCVFWGMAFGGGAVPVEAQVEPGSVANTLTSEERPIRITVQPTYQRFEDEGRTLTQWSVPLQMVVPFRDRWQVSIRGSGASAGGDNVQTLSGLTDVQAALSYARPVGEGSVILNANVNAPTGKKELSQGEFITATLLSQNFYRFRVSSFGQGLGAGTGVTWAFPVTESVVFGLGGAFQYHASYDPVAGRQQEYDPGEEGRFTAGIDIQLTRMSALSADLSLFLYGTDTVGGGDRFDAGNYGSVRVQYLHRGDGQTLRILGRYRQQEKSTLPIRNGSDRELQVLPSHGMLQARYTVGLSESVDVRVSAAGHWYEETTAFGGKTLGTIGVEPRFAVGERVSIAPRAAYTAGDITGLEGGVGLMGQF
jgi:hypothetical protein